MARLLETMTRRELTRDYRPVLAGIYVRADQPIDFAQRSRALAVAFPQGVLCGWSAAALHGYKYIPDDVNPELTLPVAARRRKDAVFRYDRLAADEHEDVYGFELTTHIRTAFDLARRSPFDAAVEVTDGLCNMGRCDPSLMRELITRHPGVRGLHGLDHVLELADQGAESPWETKTRLLLVGAGFPRPQTQYVLLDERGRHFSRVDMAWPANRIVVEYNGDHHRDRERYARDVRRENTIRRLGWDVIVATKELVTRHQQELLDRVRIAFERSS